MTGYALVAAAALWLTPGAVPVVAQEGGIPAMGNRDLAFVAATPAYRFHSDFWLNLHDYLYGTAGGGPDRRAGFEPENVACLDGLQGELRSGWDAADAYYRQHMGERHHRRDPLIRGLRYGLAGLAQEHDPNQEIGTVLGLLRAAAPAYRRCLWPMHDARNRALIGQLVATTVQHGASVQQELSDAYRSPWPTDVTVDVVSYSDYAGANTASGVALPGHMTLRSGGDVLAGFTGFELLHHEASHLIFGPGWGTVGRAIRAASGAVGVDPHRELWHALLFYTSGRAAARVAHANGDAGFEAYVKENDMWSWAYPGLEEPITEHWEAYLRGESAMDDALRRIIVAYGDGR